MNKNLTLPVTIKATALADVPTTILKWYLDNPKPNLAISLNDKSIEISGWALTTNNEPAKLLLRNSPSTSEHVFNRMRPDVIDKVLQESAIDHPQLTCGFSVSLALESFPLEIGFAIGGVVHWMRRLEIVTSQKVVPGLADYLFLANDSNRSIDQFEGKELISEVTMKAWDSYFSNLSSHNQERWAFLIAPSKEFILSDCYPYHRAPVTPVDQILERFDTLRENIIYPLNELKNNAHITYSTGDTHWTDYGAFVAAKAICSRLKIADPFSGDLPRFRLVEGDGDLISKVDSKKKLALFLADFSDTKIKISFNNHIQNHGKIYLIENEEASTNSTAILFGDSFSNNMSLWLGLAFKRVLVVHSAAAVDVGILERENPDYVICQINSRFLISAPSYGINLESIIHHKVAQLSLKENDCLEKKIDDQPPSIWKKWTKELLKKIKPSSTISH